MLFENANFSFLDEMLGNCVTCEYVSMVDVTNKSTWPHAFYFDPETQTRVMKGGGKKCENARKYEYSRNDDAFSFPDNI